MTCTLTSGVGFTVESACGLSPTPPLQVVERARREANDLRADSLGSANLNAVGIRNLHMMRVLERIAGAFNEAEIPLLAMKGAALRLLLYSTLNERPMEDLDLLVHAEDLERAGNLLKTLGAVCGEPLVQDGFCPRFHYEVEFSLGTVYPVKIDLHVRPFRPLRYSRLVPPNALWARALCVPVGRATIMVASVEDMLIHLTAHAAIHGCSQIKWLRDIHLWIAAHRNILDWDRLLLTAEEWRLVLPVREGLSSTMREVGTACPEPFSSQLARIRVAWQDRLVLWQSRRDADHPVAHVLVNTLCTPGLRFSVAYLLAVVVPSRQHMSDWYRWRHWGWFPLAQLLRWFRPILCCVPSLRLWFQDSFSETVTRPGEVA